MRTHKIEYIFTSYIQMFNLNVKFPSNFTDIRKFNVKVSRLMQYCCFFIMMCQCVLP